MKLLVGLGNPGPAHARQRHNIGFMALDAIMARFGIGPLRRRFQGEAAEGQIGAQKVLLLKPQTFMNESGRAVGEAARFYKLDAGDIIVLHDEIDLAAGKVRVKRGGGVAGHNGLKSIAAHVGPDFARVRIGIGHPGAKDKVHRHVLGDFAKADAAWLDPLLDAIAAGADRLVEGDNSNFMNEIALAGSAEPAKIPSSRPPAAIPATRKPLRKPPHAPVSEKSRAPSQRDLARSAATRHAPKPRKSAAKAEASSAPAPDAGGAAPAQGGPFAMLRRLFTHGRDAEGS